MNPRKAAANGAFAAAACVACCAPLIIAALGVTAGLAATAGIFLGLAAAIAVVLVGGAWIATRLRRTAADSNHSADRRDDPVPVAPPTRRTAS